MWDLPTPNAEPFIHVRLGKWSTTVGPVWPQLCSSKPISDSASSALQPELSGCLQVDISSATAYLPRLPSLTCLRCLIPIHLSNPQESAWASNSDQLPWCCCCCCLVTSVMSDPMQPYATHQAPLSMGFSRQEYWSGLPCLPPGDLPEPGIEPGSPALQADVFYHWAPREAHHGSSHCVLSATLDFLLYWSTLG